MTMTLTDVPEVRALIEAVRALPVRWSDGCGECPWCRLDKAMADLSGTAEPDKCGEHDKALASLPPVADERSDPPIQSTEADR